MENLKGVIFLIQNENGRFLLEQRDNDSPMYKWSWVFPGGSIEENETTEETVIREAFEEFGINLSISDISKIGECSDHLNDGHNEIFVAKINSSPKLIINESAGAGWYVIEQIRNMELGYKQSNLVLPILEKYVAYYIGTILSK